MVGLRVDYPGSGVLQSDLSSLKQGGGSRNRDCRPKEHYYFRGISLCLSNLER